MTEFEKELASLINRHSKENGSMTPDFILASYLTECLANFDRIMLWRQKWYSPEGVPAAERINGPKPTQARREPCFDCDTDGRCTMNCGPRIEAKP
jgi:hypothetical protein